MLAFRDYLICYILEKNWLIKCNSSNSSLLDIESAPARSLLFFVVDSVCLYVCLSVTLLQIDSSSLFLDGIEPFLGHQFSMTKTTKRCFRIFICCHGNEIWAIFVKISNCFFFFVLRWNRAIFWPLILRGPLYKTLFFDF